jgi:ATP-dependent Clp protease adapter protein ClpS
MNNIDPALIDPTCNNGVLNPTLFPVGTAQHMDINYNILPFLCDLLKATTDNSVSPILTPELPPFDLTPFTDFGALSAIGDPRVSLGETMTQTYVNFLPRVITQTEVRQNGGTQVIDNYICNSDGVPIKKSETIPILLSLDLTGKTSYQYGSITVPPISATFDALMNPINPEEVITYVKDYISGKKEEHADYLVAFINQYFPSWSKSIDVYTMMNFIIVVLFDLANNATVYLKYYGDTANKVACGLSLNSLNQIIAYQTPTNMALSNAMNSELPDYKDIMSSSEKSSAYYNKVKSLYYTTPDKEYDVLLADPEKAKKYLNDMSAAIAASQSPMWSQNTTIPVVKC